MIYVFFLLDFKILGGTISYLIFCCFFMHLKKKYMKKRDMLAYLSHRDWGAVHDPNVSLYMLMMQIQTSSVVKSWVFKKMVYPMSFVLKNK